MDLLRTRVQSVRLDLIGPQSRLLVRLGTWLIFLPLFALGYLLMLAALIRVVAPSIGWSVTLLLFGALHVVVGVLGVLFGRDVGLVESQPVLEPRLESKLALHAAHALASEAAAVARAHDGAGAGAPAE